MAYVTQPSSSFIKIASKNKGSLTLTIANQTLTIEDITIPAINGEISYCTLDLEILQGQDTSGATNYFMGTSWIQIQDSGATWRDAITISSGGNFRVPASDYATGVFIFRGTTDIKSYIASGGTYSIRWLDSNCLGNNLIVRGLTCIMNIYFKR